VDCRLIVARRFPHFPLHAFPDMIDSIGFQGSLDSQKVHHTRFLTGIRVLYTVQRDGGKKEAEA
jgi:hypothetical protein